MEQNIKRRERYNSNKKGVNVGKPNYDSGIWEPDDEMLAAQDEEDLDCKAPDDCEFDLDVLTDDEARVYHSNDVQFSTIREPGVVILDSDPFERVYNNLPSDHLVLRKVLICEYCGAIRFPGEGPGFCCRQGKVNLVNTPVPDDLQCLFTSQTDRDALCFRKKYSVFQLSFLVHKLWSYRGSSGRYCSC